MTILTAKNCITHTSASVVWQPCPNVHQQRARCLSAEWAPRYSVPIGPPAIEHRLLHNLRDDLFIAPGTNIHTLLIMSGLIFLIVRYLLLLVSLLNFVKCAIMVCINHMAKRRKKENKNNKPE